MEQIIHGCIREDRHSQMELFRQLAPKMIIVCKRYARDQDEAEDILQEAFIKVFDNVSKFKFEGSFEGWVRRIVVNTALKHYQKHKKRQETDFDEGYETESLEPGAFEKLSEKDLLRVINSLPEGYKMIFNLYAIEGYSHKEIGEQLGITESTSRSQLTKARKMLQTKVLKMEAAI